MGNVRMRAEQINYGASNVKAALDDLDPMDLIALNNRMNKIDAWKDTVKVEEKTGAEVTFTNALALNAVSLSAEIEAEQELHGYDHPWVGGAGKNLLSPKTTSATNNGITYTANNDGTVTVNGTATATSTFELNIFNFKNGTSYIMNGTPNGGGQYSYEMQIYINGVGYRDFGSGVTIPISEDYEGSVNIVIRNGQAVNNVIFKPMIRLSTESDATFAPYSNICPISGHTSVTITDVDAESQTATVTVQLGTTVYGGTLNVTTGVLTVTYAIKDFGDLTWTKMASGITGRNRFISAAISDIKHSNNNYVMNSISSVGYENKSANAVYNDNIYQVVAVNADGELVVADEILNSGTADQFKTARTGQTICYELATPQAIQLTPEQLTMLKGYNRLSSDGGGDITIEAYTGTAWGGDEA